MFPSLNKGLGNSEWSQPCHNKKKGSVNTLPDLKMTDQPRKKKKRREREKKYHSLSWSVITKIGSLAFPFPFTVDANNVML